MYYEDEQQRMESYYNNADLVIQGIPLEVGFEKDGRKHYTVSIEKVWKGKADALVDIATALDSAGCGISLDIDTPMIIFASLNDNQYTTGLCSGTEEPTDSLVEWLNTYDGKNIRTNKEEEEPAVDDEPLAIDCTPYICKNGDRFPRCEGKNSINYLVAPCDFSGGEGEPEELQGFRDVPSNHRNFAAISFVKSEGIVKGYEGNTFKPDQRINRAEFTKIIIMANFTGATIDECESNHLFADISQSDWFADYVCTAKENGVIDGYPDQTFRPQGFVNFAEAAKIVVGAFGIETNPEDHLGIWWRPYVFALAKIGGLPSTFSDPNQQITRGDMAEIIYRVKMGMDY
ncbi:MAG: S-layer homology domain-containing protein [bacterium]|nr:S-layer homology domain-containing protein [bacterium]MDA1292463.1 S-layer homology domain-containing protein [bacterium]